MHARRSKATAWAPAVALTKRRHARRISGFDALGRGLGHGQQRLLVKLVLKANCEPGSINPERLFRRSCESTPRLFARRIVIGTEQQDRIVKVHPAAFWLPPA